MTCFTLSRTPATASWSYWRWSVETAEGGRAQ